MHRLLVVLALLAVAVATPIVFTPDDEAHKSSYPTSSSEYLRRIFCNSSRVVGNSGWATAYDDVSEKLASLGLVEAAKLAKQVNLKQILQDSDYESVTLFLPSDHAVHRFKQQAPDVAMDQTALARLVKAGIVRGKIMSSAIANDQKAQSKEGVKLRFNIYGQEQNKKVVTVNGARVIDADHSIKNGVIHVIDKMIFPLPTGDVVQTLENVDAFSIIVDLVQRADLREELSTTDPMTILVPVNAAFKLLPSGAMDDLKANPDKLKNLLKYHVILSTQYSAGLKDGQHISAKQGGELRVNIEDGHVILNKESGESSRARIIEADIPTTNGVIHVIDRVLIPSEKHYILV